MRRFKRSFKAISPVLAVLMMIAVAIAGSLITYAWVTGYIGFTTEKSGQAIMIQSIAYNNDTSTLYVYVQNVGEGVVELNAEDSLYVNGALEACAITIGGDTVTEGKLALPEKDTATLSLVYPLSPGDKVTAKVTTLLGAFAEKSAYPVSTTGGGGGGPTPNPQWRKSITFSGVVGGPYSAFPVLISLTDSDLASRSATDGHDIYFSSDAAGTNVLAFEIEQWTQGSGTLVAWVRIPSLTASTTIYMIYGDQSISSLENPTGVWDTNYQAVWHLSEDPSGTIEDSTSYGRDGTSAGGMDSSDQVPGPGPSNTDGALEFNDASSQRIDTSNFAPGTSAMTAEAWVYHHDTGDDRVVAKSSSGSSSHASYIFSLGVSGTSLRVRLHTGGSGSSNDATTSVPLNTWTHIAFTYDDADNTIRFYVNGATAGTASKSGTIDTYSNIVVIANNDAGLNDRYWDGVIDEVRISNIARSAGWIATEYANMNNPGTFYTVGSEETV